MGRKDRTHIHHKDERRLDTLARVLTGDSVCAAVALDKARAQLILSTNLMSATDARIITEHFGSNSTVATASVPARKIGLTLDKLSYYASNQITDYHGAVDWLYPRLIDHLCSGFIIQPIEKLIKPQ